MKQVSSKFCGYWLTQNQKTEVNRLALLEFKKPVHSRRRPSQIVNDAREEFPA